MTEKRISETDYYRARAAEMLAKAQAAPSKATRIAYLNLARTWAHKAETMEKEWPQPYPVADEGQAESAATEEKE